MQDAVSFIYKGFHQMLQCLNIVIRQYFRVLDKTLPKNENILSVGKTPKQKDIVEMDQSNGRFRETNESSAEE